MQEVVNCQCHNYFHEEKKLSNIALSVTPISVTLFHFAINFYT